MPYMSIREAAEELHAGIITPGELVLETLERIDEQDGEIQAYITVMREQALTDAEGGKKRLCHSPESPTIRQRVLLQHPRTNSTTSSTP